LAFSLNKAQLIGNLGQDAEHRFTTNNVSVTTFTVATTNSYKGKDGNWVNETTWHNIVAYGLSDFYKDALKKGKKVYIEGRISKRDYTDKEGIKRYVSEIIADRYNGIIPLDSREGSSGGYQNEPSNEGSPISSAPEIESNQDDDLPF
jgi:single-strand DNA-binding protein